MARRTNKKLPELLPANEIAFISPDEMVAVMTEDGTLQRTTAGKIAEALARSKRLEPLKDKPIESFSTRESATGGSVILNGRQQTTEELAAEVFEKLSGRDGDVAEFLNIINSRLIERLGYNAGQAKEIAAIATKRFDESLQVLNNLRAGASVPNPKNY